MSNFKYTKGKWQFVRYEKTFAIETFGITNWTILQTITNQPQDEANAKLIACAPEMLEMLIKINTYLLEIEKTNNFKFIPEAIGNKEIEQLIKKATE